MDRPASQRPKPQPRRAAPLCKLELAAVYSEWRSRIPRELLWSLAAQVCCRTAPVFRMG